MVKEVTSEAEYKRILASSACVVDFTASWWCVREREGERPMRAQRALAVSSKPARPARSSAWAHTPRSRARSHALILTPHPHHPSGPCRMMAPVFESLASKHPALTFIKVDVDALQSVAAGAGVTGMPTFVAYDGGREAGRVVGADQAGLAALVAGLARSAKPSFGSGPGRTLGGGGGGSASAAPVPTPAAPAPAAIDAPGLEDAAPTCLVTIRLHDGAKLVGRFNPARHTVGALADFAVAQGAKKGGSLVAGFPPAPLADREATLASAGLVNCLVTWRP